jgi:hypothetical protein
LAAISKEVVSEGNEKMTVCRQLMIVRAISLGINIKRPLSTL